MHPRVLEKKGCTNGPDKTIIRANLRYMYRGGLQVGYAGF